MSGNAVNHESEKPPEIQIDTPAKTSSKPGGLRVLEISIHMAHAAWMAALVMSVAANGSISSYALFMPLLILASCLEMWRWALLGRQLVETKGPYSHASAVDAVNRDFLLFSWYVLPPLPPFKLLERYGAILPEAAVKRQRSQILARFWLRSEATLPLSLLCFFFFLFPLESPPNLWGLGKFLVVSRLFWVVEFGLFSKLLSVFLFSAFLRIFKGF